MAMHIFDDDQACLACHFDAVEWHYEQHQTAEGRANPQPMPTCSASSTQRAAAMAMLRALNAYKDVGDFLQDWQDAA